MDVQGRTVREETDIARVAIDYFSTLFTSQPTATPLLQEMVQPCTISVQIQQRLALSYKKEELVGALQEMHLAKAPGPDGLPVGFFQKFWPQVKREVIDYCLNVLNNRAIVRSVN